MSLKNSNDIIGNRNRELPACSAMPEPSALGVPSLNIVSMQINSTCHIVGPAFVCLRVPSCAFVCLRVPSCAFAFKVRRQSFQPVHHEVFCLLVTPQTLADQTNVRLIQNQRIACLHRFLYSLFSLKSSVTKDE